MVERRRGRNSTYERIWAAVRKIPAGRVSSYGLVARAAGMPGHARLVGYALHALDSDDVPWHRVINNRGAISLPEADGRAALQRTLLEAEGVVFEGGRADLMRFGWYMDG
jgi:methylated-DNA-protein-cysteine methyltransferase-like protein